MEEEVYYQPEECDWGRELYSFEVYASKELCQEHFPGISIIEYRGEDIEGHTYVD